MGDQWFGSIVGFAPHQKLPPGYEIDGIFAADETAADRRPRAVCYYWCAMNEYDEDRHPVCGDDVDSRWEAYRQAWARYRARPAEPKGRPD